jgi:hypothetical protein
MSIFKTSVNLEPYGENALSNIATGTLPVIDSTIVLNGSMVSSATGQVSFIDSKYASGLSFTSDVDMSAATFTIVGSYNGLLITESVKGPNVNTVHTNNLFHTIISISININWGVAAGTFTIGSNYNIAIVAENLNGTRNYICSPYTYNILIAGPAWAGGNEIYGVSKASPTSLQVSSLTSLTRFNNYFPLSITQSADFKICRATYPYAAVIVYLAARTNASPVFIEISQS